MIIKNKEAVMNKHEKLQKRLATAQEKKKDAIATVELILEELASVEKDVHIIELEERLAELEKGAADGDEATLVPEAYEAGSNHE